jgi:hypothetical protein
VFANVMAGALRLMGVPADNIDSIPQSRRDNTLLQASAAPAAPITRADASESNKSKKVPVKAPARVVNGKAQATAR